MQSVLKGRPLSVTDRNSLSLLANRGSLSPLQCGVILKLLGHDLNCKQAGFRVVLPSSGSGSPPIPFMPRPFPIPNCPPPIPSGGGPGVDPGIAGPPGGGSDIDPNPPEMNQFGLQIQELQKDGPAEAAGLKVGDVLVSINDQRVQSFDEMSVLAQGAQGEIELVYVEGESGELRKVLLEPRAGKLGVSVEPIPVQFQ